MSKRDFEAIADMLFSTVRSDDDVMNFSNKFSEYVKNTYPKIKFNDELFIRRCITGRSGK